MKIQSGIRSQANPDLGSASRYRFLITVSKTELFLFLNGIFLFLDLCDRLPSYRERLQLSQENFQRSKVKNMKFLHRDPEWKKPDTGQTSLIRDLGIHRPT
jgi:hypothetical protein